MMKNDAPKIATVQIAKVNRFWNLTVNGKLLAIVLYKRGAEEARQLIEQLAGLPVTMPEGEKKNETKSESLPRTAKQPVVNKKAKPPAKSAGGKPEASHSKGTITASVQSPTSL